ncbi:MAG: hypothetical protein ABSA52_18000, partial [Candidatus Binatia bacterium]
SYRTRHLPPLDLPDSNSDHATKPDRISGKKRTQFPEPTPSKDSFLAERWKDCLHDEDGELAQCWFVFRHTVILLAAITRG